MNFTGKNISPRVLILGYHEVTDNPYSSGFQRESAMPYKHSTIEFRSHLDIFLRRNNTQLPVSVIAENRHEDQLLFTFDDGGASALISSEILDEYGIKGTYFIPTKYIGRKGFLTRSQIQDLSTRGHNIGSHSHTHSEPFYMLSKEQQLDEWRKSLDILSDLVGQKIKIASIPGGDMNNKCVEYARDNGIEYLFTSEFRYRLWQIAGIHCVGRYFPKVGTGEITLRRISNFKDEKKHVTVRKAKNIIKRIIYPFMIDSKRIFDEN